MVKITVLHGEDGKQSAAKALRQLRKYVPDAGKLLLGSEWTRFRGRTAESLGSAARLVLVFSPAVTGSSWFPFLLGFSLGRGIPILGYGADAVLPAFADRIIPLKGDDEFAAYLAASAPAWFAEERGQEARKTLLDRGIPLTGNAFENCIKEGKAEEVSLFLAAGFPADAKDDQGVPALCLAARSGERDIVNTLLKAGADVNAASGSRGGSALIDSAMGKFPDIGADLLAAGADVNVKSRDGQSALIFSVGLNDTAFTEMLLKAGANPDEPDALGAGARKYAVLFNKPEIMELFEKYAGK
jgi:hypothetical protein